MEAGDGSQVSGSQRPPNLVLLITDQQRQPRHWPDEPGWVEALAPSDAELRRTGLTFTNAFCNTAMCSPSRGTLLTGLFPAEHGVELTLTADRLRPDPRNAPAVIRTMGDLLRRRQAPPRRIVTQFLRTALRLGPSSGGEPALPPALPNLATLLRQAGYRVAYKGKWHLSHPSGEGDLLGGWSAADAAAIERDYGFSDWEPPDAGENAEAEHFGGGSAGGGQGWDEVYTRQAERWLADAEAAEPFCLVVSLVNPHDVLGYPRSFERGGYSAAEFADLGVGLPETADEDLRPKPSVQAMARMGMDAYLGPLRSEREQLAYVRFYAHLHRLVDVKVARILAALGDPRDPGSLRSRTVVVRCSDHGEMGLAHGGLRQKMFNAYEETINVPLVISNPVLFPRRAETGALAGLVDLLPTLLTLCGLDASQRPRLRGRDLSPLIARHAGPERERLERSPVDLAAFLERSEPADSVRDDLHFTYDDHQAGTATQEAPGQPNRIRAIRTRTMKYAVYHDPSGRTAPEHELYDLERDPNEARNLVDSRTGEPAGPGIAALRDELAERLREAMADCSTQREGAGG
jgi:choline-sulfatase